MASMRHYDLDAVAGELPKDGVVIIASASYNGAPPDNAARFVKWLNEARRRCGREICRFRLRQPRLGIHLSGAAAHDRRTLEALGATRLRAREGDAREDLDGQFQDDWFKTLWPQVGKGLGLDIDFRAGKAEPLYEMEVISEAATNPAITQSGAKPVTITANTELQNVKKSGRSTRHIEVALPKGATYRPGDHLCVVPRNSLDLVERVERRFGFAPGARIRLKATGGRHAPFRSKVRSVCAAS
jgi:cytochrome P450/NADPH-cytochrome P450 reductase